MIDAAVEFGLGLVATYGLAVLLVVFVLEGALIGKVIPTRTLFVAAALAVGRDTFGLVSVAAVAVVGATLGQLLLFALVRRTDLSIESLPGASEPVESRFEAWLDRWGMGAVAVSNTLPVARGSLTVPAAMADGNALRFSASSMAGSSMYAVGLVAVAAGIDSVIGFI